MLGFYNLRAAVKLLRKIRKEIPAGLCVPCGHFRKQWIDLAAEIDAVIGVETDEERKREGR